MRSRWNLPVYIGYLLMCIVVIAVFAVLPLGLVFPWQSPYKVTATFRTGDGILKNNEVFMNGTRVAVPPLKCLSKLPTAVPWTVSIATTTCP